MKQKTFEYAFFKSIPIMAGYLVIGFGFGILLSNKGYSTLWALFMSLVIYAGSLQYIGVSFLANKISYLSVALFSFFINARHIFYGISMLEKYQKTGKLKFFLIPTLTDETYSLVCTNNFPEFIDRKEYFFFVSLLNYFYWIFGSFLGALIGNSISINTTGIDFAMTALFAVVFIEQWENTENHLASILGLLISILSLLVFGKNNFLIPAMIGILISLVIFRKYTLKNKSFREKEDENND